MCVSAPYPTRAHARARARDPIRTRTRGRGRPRVEDGARSMRMKGAMSSESEWREILHRFPADMDQDQG
jgi:hypothetical protein